MAKRWATVMAAVAGLAGSVVLAACGDARGGSTLRLSGSTTVNPVAADAAEALRGADLDITVDSQGGSAGGIAQLAAGQVEIAMSSKPIAGSDRSAHPDVAFVTTSIGEDAVGVIVRREVYDGGVRSLTREQLQRLFEGRVANWQELGGPDLVVFIYDKEPGRGTREVLDRYLYADAPPPPPPQSDGYAVVGGNEETRTKLKSTPGSVGPLSTAFVTGHPELAAVAIGGIEATPENISQHLYPLARPLLLVTDGPPTGPARTFVDYALSPAGQQLVRKHGFLTLADLSR